jgi:hypothetical protein
MNGPVKLGGARNMHGRMVNAYKISVGKSGRRDYLEDVRVERTILKWILDMGCEEMDWIIWLGTGTTGYLL